MSYDMCPSLHLSDITLPRVQKPHSLVKQNDISVLMSGLIQTNRKFVSAIFAVFFFFVDVGILGVVVVVAVVAACSFGCHFLVGIHGHSSGAFFVWHQGGHLPDLKQKTIFFQSLDTMTGMAMT